ncbi:hypothetical protein D3C80_1891340 [compost metagenome]
MRQQMLNGNRLIEGILKIEIRHIFGEIVLQTNFPLFHKLHGSNSGKGFGYGSDTEYASSRVNGLLLFLIRVTIALLRNNLAILHDHNRSPDIKRLSCFRSKKLVQKR